MSSEYDFQSQAAVEQAINTLKGVLQGVDIDSEIESDEVEGLRGWIGLYEPLKDIHPFNELFPVVMAALEDGRIDATEKADILWLSHQLTKNSRYLDRVTASLQEMNGVLAGVLLDGELKEDEVYGLKAWLDKNTHLRRVWPYDEVDSLVNSIIASQQVTSDELDILRDFLSTFLGIDVDDETSDQADDVPYSLTGICAKDPDLSFNDKVFSLAGKFNRDRVSIVAQIEAKGGRFSPDVNADVDVLVVGADGNPCWAYACYGRKIEQAINLRKQGGTLVIAHEFDLMKALQ